MKQTTLLLLLLFAPNFSFAQQKKKRCIVSTIKKEGYQYIPKSVFADSVDGVINIDIFDETIHPLKQLSAWWGSFCNDGEYILTITPEQIYFRSGHENPNPNLLYWAIEITPQQYTDLVTGMRKKKKLDSAKGATAYNILHKKDDVDFPKWWKEGATDSTWNSYCNKSMRQHLEKYFADFNKCIPRKHKKLVLPPQQELDKIDAKFFGWKTWDIERWLNR